MQNRFDTTALSRAFVGFDRLFDNLTSQSVPNYPPFNILKTQDGDYIVEVAVTGFSKDEITVTSDRSTLTIRAERNAPTDQTAQYFHQGLAARNFERVFTLMDYAQVTKATIENGLLRVFVTRVIPDELKPRTIDII